MHRIAVLDDFQNVALNYGDWKGLARDAEITVFTDHVNDEDALVARLLPFDMVCAMRERTRFPRSLLERLPNLKMIASTGPWNAAIDIDATDALGITVCGTGTSLTAAGELTWALILAVARQVPAEVQSFRNGGWQVGVGADLHGKTIGLLGLGYTGGVTAKIAQAFGMKLVAWSQNMTPASAAEHGARLVSKDELFTTSDIVSVHVRLSDRTRGLVGARELALMKKTAFLINTARGPIVDEAALLETLKAGRIAGAGVDVFGEEPLAADHPFRKLTNLVATGHVGYVTHGSYDVYYGESVENMRAWIDGKPIRTLTSTRREISYESKT
jgi:phosphoglycerate dehydrogenase-like enzyme